MRRIVNQAALAVAVALALVLVGVLLAAFLHSAGW